MVRTSPARLVLLVLSVLTPSLLSSAQAVDLSTGTELLPPYKVTGLW